MTDYRAFEPKTDPAEFMVLTNAMFTIAREMGKNMERTARAPVYFSAHDFITTLVSLNHEIVCLAEYIPVLVGATPFATRAVSNYFGDDVHEGDVFLNNDPYTDDGGNQMADWSIVYPIFWNGEQVLWVANKAHQQDTGGGVPGGYNPNAIDVYAEGLRIPPLRIFEAGKERKDVMNLILTNVRVPTAQRGDLLSLIGAARVGERRVKALYDLYGKEAMDVFIEDLLNYGESLMRAEISKLPDGTYHSEITGIPGSSPLVCDLTIDGDEMTVDLTKSGPQVQDYINSPLANTFSSVAQALMTSVGRHIRFRVGSCYRPVRILTTPGTITHASYPIPHGNCTNCVAKQIIELVWSALAQAAPKATPAGWGSIPYWIYSGIDPRRNEPYGTPCFLGSASGAGAIWGTDGWGAAGPTICSGTLYRPEIEIFENTYPAFYRSFEYAPDSGAPGRWRGGMGVRNELSVDSAPFPMHVASGADPYDYTVAPAIDGGKLPKPNSKTIQFADGSWADAERVRREKLFLLHQGDTMYDWVQGGAGVGSPLERPAELVQEDVRDEVVSVESARDDYGVVIDPVTFELDVAATEKLRKELAARD